MEWVHDSLYPGESFKDLDAIASKSPAGSNNLYFCRTSLARCPYADPYAKGVFFGLTRSHGKGIS